MELFRWNCGRGKTLQRTMQSDYRRTKEKRRRSNVDRTMRYDSFVEDADNI